MATRLYLPSSGTAPVTPSTWEFTAQINPVTYKGSVIKTGTALTTLTQATGTTSPIFRAMARWVFGPLASQTISGTIKSAIQASESNQGANATLAIAVKLVQPSGTDRSVLLAQTASDLAGGVHEFSTSLASRRLYDATETLGATLTSQTATNGDYLVIEMGFRSATTTSRNISLRIGDTGTDVADADGTAADNAGWVELSANLVWPSKVYVIT